MPELDDYIKRKSLDICKSIGNRKLIYLDTNFWIRLLTQKDEQEKQFYEVVNSLFENGKCIFPVSEIIVAEIEKQADLGSRYRNIQIIDRFSNGFAIMNEPERRKIEFKHWLQKKIGIETHELKELIWSKVSFAKLGYLFLTPANDSLLQKHLSDFTLNYVENAPLLEMEMGNSDVFVYKPNADILNEEIQKHAHEHTLFRDIALAEICGVLQEYKSLFADIIIDDPKLEHNLTRSFVQAGKSKEDFYMEIVFGLFYANHMFNELPAFHIFSILFAHIRFKKIKYKGGNDTIDFLHASFALPYCDYFFTDKKLYFRINELELDSLYNCTTEHDLQRAIEILNSIQ